MYLGRRYTSLRLLTFESLYNFFVEQNKDFSFSNTNEPIVVQVPANFADTQKSEDGLLHVFIKAAHTNLNRNQSFIAENTMKSCLHTIYNKPILANIIELDNGEKDFHSHDFVVNEETGETYYIEHSVGHIPESGNAHLEYDEENGKTYVVVEGVIYEDYGNEAADIIRSKETNDVSVEIEIYDLSFNAKDKYLEINDFSFRGITLLGSEKNGKKINPGMEGAKLSLEDFSESKNSLVYCSQLLEELDKKINSLINTKEGKETKMTKFEELLEQYSVTAEDITFDTEGLSDEELEKAFADAFVQQEPGANMNKSFSVTLNDKVRTFEVSLDEVIYALETLVNDTYAEADNAYYGVKVYENTVVMVDYYTGRAYRQTYKKKKKCYSLSGDRVEVYARYVTQDEEAALDEMRGKYQAMEEKLNQYEVAEIAEKKTSILNSEDYSSISESEEFKSFAEDVLAEGNEKAYSVEDVQAKCDAMLLSYAKSQKATFAAEKPSKQIKVKTGIHEKEYKPYGNLFK